MEADRVADDERPRRTATRDPLGRWRVALDLLVPGAVASERPGPAVEVPSRAPELTARDVLQWTVRVLDVDEVEVQTDLGLVLGIPVPLLRAEPPRLRGDGDGVPEVEV